MNQLITCMSYRGAFAPKNWGETLDRKANIIKHESMKIMVAKPSLAVSTTEVTKGNVNNNC